MSKVGNPIFSGAGYEPSGAVQAGLAEAAIYKFMINAITKLQELEGSANAAIVKSNITVSEQLINAYA